MPLSSRLMLQALLAACALGFYTAAHSAGDPARGKELSYTCLGCHGIPDYKNVYPTYSVPELGGQHPEYIVAALKEYKSGQRSHATMHQQAASLSDQDMQDIAAYFVLRFAQAWDRDAVAQGTGEGGAGRSVSATARMASASLATTRRWRVSTPITWRGRCMSTAHGDRKNAVMPNFVTGLRRR